MSESIHASSCSLLYKASLCVICSWEREMFAGLIWLCHMANTCPTWSSLSEVWLQLQGGRKLGEMFGIPTCQLILLVACPSTCRVAVPLMENTTPLSDQEFVLLYLSKERLKLCLLLSRFQRFDVVYLWNFTSLAGGVLQLVLVKSSFNLPWVKWNFTVVEFYNLCLKSKIP